MLQTLHSEEFLDATPYQIVPMLLERGEWLCSIRTMYRILAKNSEVKERRHQRRHPSYEKPVVIATGPNQVWTWDITRLPGPFKGKSFYLYVMLDLYSRFVVGWMVAHEENASQAQYFIRESLKKQNVDPACLTIHSDRGSPMTASSMITLFAVLGLSQSFSRPRVSNDNPFSESHFKTLKYHRMFKNNYENIDDAKQTLDKFFAWYNNEHMHSGLGLMTPKTVYECRAEEVAAQRFEVLKAACNRHPERFPNGATLPLPPKEVGINITKNNSKPAISYLNGNVILNS